MIRPFLLTVPVSGVDKLKPVRVHRAGPQYHRQVLVVDGVLPQGDDDPTSFLVEPFAVPVRIQLVQRVLDVIVLPHPDDMLRRYAAEFVHTTVA